MKCRAIDPSIGSFPPPPGQPLNPGEAIDCPSHGPESGGHRGGCGCGCGGGGVGSNYIAGEPTGGGGGVFFPMGDSGPINALGGGACGCGGGKPWWAGGSLPFWNGYWGNDQPWQQIFSGMNFPIGGDVGPVYFAPGQPLRPPNTPNPTLNTPAPAPVQVVELMGRSNPNYGIEAANSTLGLLNNVNNNADSPLGDYQGGTALQPQIDPTTGNAYVLILTPRGGPFDPQPMLAYSSAAPASSSYGFGWNSAWDRTVTQVSGTVANVTTASGKVYTFSNLIGGLYQPASGLGNSLQTTASGGWMEKEPQGTTYNYDSNGILQYVSSPASDRWTISRDGSNRITRITDPFARRTTFSLDGSNNLKRITDSAGRITTFTVDGSGNLTKVIRPDNNRTTMAYDSGHRLTTWNPAGGPRLTLAYDATSHQATSIRMPDGGRVSMVYYSASKGVFARTAASGADFLRTTMTITGADNLVTRVMNPLTQRATYVFTSGFLTNVTNPLSNQWAVAMQTSGNYGQRLNTIAPPDTGGAPSPQTSVVDDTTGDTVTITDQAGQLTTFRYDGNRNRIAIIDALSRRVTYFYNSHGQQTGIRNPLNFRATFVYDTVGRIKALSKPTAQRVTFGYDSYGNAIWVSDPSANRTTYVRDAIGNVNAIVDPLARRTSFLYDAARRVTGVINPLRNRSTYSYDSMGRVNTVYDPLNNSTAAVYKAGEDHPIRVTDALGRTTTFVYDSVQRQIAVVNPILARWTTIYDTAGNLMAVIDPLLRRNTTVYDIRNRAAAQINGLGYRTSFIYDKTDGLIAVQDALNNRTTTVYDSAYRQVAQINALGNRWTTVYDAGDRPVAAINPLLNRLSTGYDTSGKVQASINALNLRTTFLYDPNGRQVAMLDPLLRRSTVVFDVAGQAKASINSLGNRTSFVFDFAGRGVSRVNALNQRTSSVYDAANRFVASINALSYRTSRIYDSAWQLIGNIDALNRRNSIVYDTVGRAVASIDPLAHRSTTVYDVANQNVAGINALNNRSTVVYSQAGQVLSEATSLGFRTTYIYDALGRQLAVLNAKNYRVTTSYDALGRIRSLKNASGYVTSYSYDASSRRTAVKNALNNVTTFIYDAIDNNLATVTPLNSRITFSYDAANQRIRSINPLAYTYTTTFDLVGQVKTVINPLNLRSTIVMDAIGNQLYVIDANSHRTTNVYNSINGRVALIAPSGNRTSFIYNETNNLVARADGKNNRVSFILDILSRRVSTIDPLSRRVTMTYDSIGQLTYRLDPAGTRTTYSYNRDGNISSFRYPNSTIVTYKYDAVRQKTSHQIGAIIGTLVYDPDGRIVSDRNTAGVITCSFDAIGERISIKTQTGNNITFSYDTGANLLTMIRPSGRISYQYDAIGRRTQYILPARTICSYAYDAGNRVSKVTYIRPDNSIHSQYNPKYNNIFLPIALVDLAGTTTIAYDLSYQIANERRSGSNSYNITYIYDGIGNRVAKIDSGVRTSYVYDNYYETLFSYQTNARTTYTYDLFGNIIRQQNKVLGVRKTYQYDYEGNVLLNRGTVPVTYCYDGMFRLIGHNIPGSRTTFLYLGNTRLAEINNGVFSGYTSDGRPPHQTLYGKSGSKDEFYLFDPVGTTRSVVDSSCTDARTFVTDSFGNVLNRDTDFEDFVYLGNVLTNSSYGVILNNNNAFDPILDGVINNYQSDGLDFAASNPYYRSFITSEPRGVARIASLMTATGGMQGGIVIVNPGRCFYTFCGPGRTGVEFQIRGMPGNLLGVIIQHVKSMRRTSDCGGRVLVNENHDFYEIWGVDGLGNVCIPCLKRIPVFPFVVLSCENIARPPHDINGQIGPPPLFPIPGVMGGLCTVGFWNAEYEVQYIPGTYNLDCWELKFCGEPKEPAGDLPIYRKGVPPKFDASLTIRRKFTSAWNCCPCGPGGKPIFPLCPSIFINCPGPIVPNPEGGGPFPKPPKGVSVQR